jgi:CheY-like chemotaxis protein
VVLDLVLPGQEGEEVVEQIRRSPELRDLPLTLYSALDLSAEDRARLRLDGADVMTKGRITPEQLETHVVSLLKRLIDTADNA